MKTFDIIGQVEPVSDVNKLRQDKGNGGSTTAYNRTNKIIRLMEQQEIINIMLAERTQKSIDKNQKQREERRKKILLR